MKDFLQAYDRLNEKQKLAVDTTEGPVMVVAGPGTGKTQLLAVRVANILRKNETLLPTNILCLTFTEAGQAAMQKRLVEIMGDAGAHVAVHTFHSFGAEIINRYPQYFYGGLQYQPADPLATHEILLELFEELPHDNVLASKNNGEYVYLGSVKKLLGQIKKAALSPEEIKHYARNGLRFIDYIEPALVEVFAVDRFATKADIDRSDTLLDRAASYRDETKMSAPNSIALADVFRSTFEIANELAHVQQKAKPLNEWKKDWYKKDKAGTPVCKQREIHEKLLAFADIYKQYRHNLDKRRLFDFDDMISRVVHAVETDQELAYDIQERYQYFLVDEFQDTNAGQLRLLTALANHPVHEGRPNVMVVGDDDQAIFAFQGAELSNILAFESAYVDVARIVLEDNYRSKSEILGASRAVITQGVDRLENHQNITKTLYARNTKLQDVRIERQQFGTQAEEFYWLAQEVSRLLANGHKPSEIAIICREHKHLEALLPYMSRAQVPVWYERQQNAFDEPVVRQLLVLVRTVHALAIGSHQEAEALLPELLAAPYWKLSGEQLWRIGLQSARSGKQGAEHKGWLEVLLDNPIGSKEHTAAMVLLEAAKLARTEPLEAVLDALMGTTEFSAPQEESEESEGGEAVARLGGTLASPFRQYYFSSERLADNPRAYNDALTALVALRNRVRQFNTDGPVSLEGFLHFVDLSISANVGVTSRPVLGSQAHSVQLLTVHGSKGLEYETVFLLSTVADVWDKMPRGDKLALPPNMLHIAHPAQADDNLRTLFVAMTRAKRQLVVSEYMHQTVGGKAAKVLGALEHPNALRFLPSKNEPTPVIFAIPDETALLEANWNDVYTSVSAVTLHELLADQLLSYRLSVTHLNNFLDVEKNGPEYFLLNNVLRFPSSMSPSGAFGDAVHKTLQWIHVAIMRGDKLPDTQAAKAQFERLLSHKQLGKHDFKNYLLRGQKAIDAFYETYGGRLRKTQTPEQDFYAQGVRVGEARLSGKLDLIESIDGNVLVTDYKTGRPLTDWSDTKKTADRKSVV